MHTIKLYEDLTTFLERLFQQGITWPELIKTLRATYYYDIETAQKAALSHQGWRRLCNHQINHDPQCRKQAIWHMRHHVEDSWVIREGDRLHIVDPWA